MKGEIFIKRVVISTALFISIQSYAQTDGLGTWNVLTSKLTFNKKLFTMAEVQVRSQHMYKDFTYYEYKAGIGYNFPKSLSAMLAMGHYMTYDPLAAGNFKGNIQNNEFRIWEQFVLENNINRVKIEHRYRIEQRFTSTGYKNRFRYRLNTIIPLNHVKIQPKTWFLSVFDEVFINNESPFLEQNRIFFGAGYELNKNLTFLGGYINRFDNGGGTNQIWKNFFQINAILTFDEFKSGREKMPSALD